MSEIDVSKCDYYFQGRCGVSKNINYSIGCYANDCYYKQLQEVMNNLECAELRNKYDKEKFDSELQQLKAENEELKHKLTIMTGYFEKADGESFKYKQCLDEIEDIIEECKTNDGCYDTCKYYDLCNCDTDSFILNIIKQAKEGDNG